MLWEMGNLPNCGKIKLYRSLSDCPQKTKIFVGIKSDPNLFASSITFVLLQINIF